MRVKDKTALKAAETIIEYCKTMPNNCKGCIFNKDEPEAVFSKGCLLNEPGYLPEMWEIKAESEVNK